MVERTRSGAPVLTATEARQGFRGRPILVVLVVSLALVCVLLAGFYFHYWPL